MIVTDAPPGIGEMEHRVADCGSASVYREFAPCEELRDHVRALAWYGPARDGGATAGSRSPLREFFVGLDGQLAPTFADAHSSLLFPLGVTLGVNGWHVCSPDGPTMMGAVTRATEPPAERSAMIGVYLRPRGCAALLGIPAAELSDRIIPLRELWKQLPISADRPSLNSVEALLVARLRAVSPSARALQIASLASHVRRRAGRVSVTDMANLAGVSRQHLGRLFLEYVGVSPKSYARLARFRAGLRHLTAPERSIGWSGLATQLGYADQSHLIAEFREFTGLTPEQLVRGDRFHPFIGDDRSE